MATVKTIIKKSKANKAGLVPIYLQYCYQTQTSIISTGQRILPQEWNDGQGRPKKMKRRDDLQQLHDLLEKEKTRMEAIIREARLEGTEPSLQYVKEIFLGKKIHTRKPRARKKSIWQWFDEFIEAGRLTKQQSTIRVYINTQDHLKGFSKEKGRKVAFDKIDSAFCDAWMRYLIEEQGMRNSSVGKYVKTLKSFLNWVRDQGEDIRMDYQKFKVLKEEKEIVFLTKEELDHLESLDLTEDPRLGRVRDLFCLGCYTALRYSDLAKLSQEMFADGYLRMRSQKQNEIITIPLIPQAKAIIEKYTDEQGTISLPTLSNVKFNAYLKELGQLAEFDTPITITKQHGSKRIHEKRPKYELLTVHTARRTFVTLSFMLGVEPEVLRRITGHKSTKVFQKYLEISDRQKEEAMLKAWGNL